MRRKHALRAGLRGSHGGEEKIVIEGSNSEFKGITTIYTFIIGLEGMRGGGRNIHREEWTRHGSDRIRRWSIYE